MILNRFPENIENLKFRIYDLFYKTLNQSTHKYMYIMQMQNIILYLPYVYDTYRPPPLYFFLNDKYGCKMKLQLIHWSID